MGRKKRSNKKAKIGCQEPPKIISHKVTKQSTPQSNLELIKQSTPESIDNEVMLIDEESLHSNLFFTDPNTKCYPLIYDTDIQVAVRPSIDIPIDQLNIALSDDICLVEEIVNDIYNNYNQNELRLLATNLIQLNANGHITDQTFITSGMMEILIDWLGEVHEKFKYTPDTLFLTISIIYEYLALIKDTRRSRLQLLGITAYLIASKYEEIYSVEIKDLIYITDKAYNKNDILLMELDVLNILGFNITRPTIHTFLCYYLKHAHATRQVVYIACYICQRILQDTFFIQFLPSLVAASAVYIAREYIHVQTTWSKTLQYYTKYNESDLLLCVNRMKELISEKSQYNSCYRKFSKAKYSNVAQLFYTE